LTILSQKINQKYSNKILFIKNYKIKHKKKFIIIKFNNLFLNKNILIKKEKKIEKL
jgi:hypothetical protein